MSEEGGTSSPGYTTRILYFSESSELHVHLLHVDVLPWRLGPVRNAGLVRRTRFSVRIYTASAALTLEEERQEAESCMNLDKDDHVPDGFDQYDIASALTQLLVLGESDLKQIRRVLQVLHLCLHHCHRSIRLATETSSDPALFSLPYSFTR